MKILELKKLEKSICYNARVDQQMEVFDMSVHSFKKGDEVTIFQMSPSKGLFIEGAATVRKIIKDVDEQYTVEFTTEPGETYERFIDREGQENPPKYVREFNRRIGVAT